MCFLELLHFSFLFSGSISSTLVVDKRPPYTISMDSTPTLIYVITSIVMFIIVVPYCYILSQIFINECLTTEVKIEEKKEESLVTQNSELLLNPVSLRLDLDEVERLLQPHQQP